LSLPLIELEDITVKRRGRAILQHVSFKIEANENVAILGPNGSGKSTLIQVLAREIYPYGGKGSVRILGRDRWVIADLRTLLGMVAEGSKEPLLGEPTGLDVAISGLIGTFGVLAQHEVTAPMTDQGREALARVEASQLAGQPVSTMSTGERRRVFIARALVSRPKALVLDEPTSGLDMRAAYEFHRTIRRLAQEGTSIILVTHHLEEIVPEIGRVILMKDGKVTADGPRNTVLQARNVAELFDFAQANQIEWIESRLRQAAAG
jgi:iron complex transport system ATP-binding protein